MIELLTAVALPQAKGPIPEVIGVETIFAYAGAGGVIGLVVASSRGLQGVDQDEWARKGVVWGFRVGISLYALALVGRLL